MLIKLESLATWRPLAIASLLLTGTVAEGAEYTRMLPLYAQEALDLGHELPSPYGISIMATQAYQVPLLSDFSANINGLSIGGLEFESTAIQSTGKQLKLDAWVLPFLNVYAVAGKLKGKADIALRLDGEAAALFGALSLPCTTCSSLVMKTSYRGETVTLGFTAFGSWGQYFVALPVAYTWSDIDILSSHISTITASPRFGTYYVSDWGNAAVYAGASHMSVDSSVAGSVDLKTVFPDMDSMPVEFSLNYKLSDSWSYVLGFDWEINKHWNVQAEGNIGDSYKTVVSSLTYRF